MWDFFAATVPLELPRACSSRTVAPAGELAIQTSFSSGDGGSSSPGKSWNKPTLKSATHPEFYDFPLGVLRALAMKHYFSLLLHQTSLAMVVLSPRSPSDIFHLSSQLNLSRIDCNDCCCGRPAVG